MLRIVRVTAPALVAVLAATFLTAPPSHAAAYPTCDDVIAARSSEAATAEKQVAEQAMHGARRDRARALTEANGADAR